MKPLRLAAYTLILLSTCLLGQNNYDTSGNLLVNVAAGGGAGGTSSTFGAAFPGTGTAVGFKDGGGLMQPGLLDGSNFLEIDCKAGCSGAAGDTTASGTLAAGGNTVTMSMAGVTSASFSLPATSTLVATVVADYSTDGGTSYPNSTNLRTAGGQWGASISVTNTGAAQDWNIQIPGGASNIRVRVSVYTSGTSGVNGALLRAVQQPELVSAYSGVAAQAIPPYVAVVGGSDGTNARALAVDTLGNQKVTGTGTAGTAATGVLTVQGIASMTHLLVTPDANAAVNIAQLAGTTTDTNSGLKSAGTLRVVIATDQPQLTNKLLVTPDANSAVNVAQFGGSNVVTGTGAGGAGIPRVTVSNDSNILATQSGTWTVQPGNTANTTAWLVTGGLSDNGAAAAANRFGVLPGIAESNFPAALTAGRDAALRTDLRGNLLSALMPATSFATYAAAKTGLATAASATDIAVLSGNATNTVVVTRVMLSCTQTTAGIVDVQLLIRTTADTAGTSTGSPTTFPLDQNNAAASSSVLTYTANPTVNDATARLVDSYKLGVLAPASVSPADVYIWTPTMGQSIVLRGTAQQAALNLNATTVTGSSCDVRYQWIETTGL